LRQTWTGRPVSFDGLRARVSRWPPLRLARMRRERGSVGVVLPASCFTRPVRVGGEGSDQTVFRLGRAPRLRSGGDLAGRPGAPGRPDRDDRRGAEGVRRQPGAHRRGRAGGDRKHQRDRARAAGQGRADRGRQPAEDPGDRRGQGQDRQGRRRDPRAAAGLRLPAGGVGRRRGHPGAPAAGRAARTSCASAPA
jgi:hypothetical protein